MTAPPSSPSPLNLQGIDNPIVRSAIQALNSRNKEQWYKLFSDNPMLTDDGNPHDFTKWCEAELFSSSLAYLASVDKVEDGGLTVYGKFHSDKWGDSTSTFSIPLSIKYPSNVEFEQKILVGSSSQRPL